MSKAEGSSSTQGPDWTPIDEEGNWEKPPTEGKGRLDKTIDAVYQRIKIIRDEKQPQYEPTEKIKSPEKQKEFEISVLRKKQSEIQRHKSQLESLKTKVEGHIERTTNAEWKRWINTPIIGRIVRHFMSNAIKDQTAKLTKLTNELTLMEERIKAKLASSDASAEMSVAISLHPSFQNFHTDEAINKIIEELSKAEDEAASKILKEQLCKAEDEAASKKLEELCKGKGAPQMLFRRDPANPNGFIISVKTRANAATQHMRFNVEKGKDNQLIYSPLEASKGTQAVKDKDKQEKLKQEEEEDYVIPADDEMNFATKEATGKDVEEDFEIEVPSKPLGFRKGAGKVEFPAAAQQEEGQVEKNLSRLLQAKTWEEVSRLIGYRKSENAS